MQPIVYGNLDEFSSMFLNNRKNRIKYGKKLNYKLFMADINTDRKSYNAWRRYTVKIRGIDMVSVSLFLCLEKILATYNYCHLFSMM